MRLTRRALFAGFGALAGAGPTVAAAGTGPRVAVIDLQLVEMLLTLGVVPLAVANAPLYRRLVADPPIPAGVADLGPLNEPHLELLQYLKPDLILAAGWQRGSLSRLERVAPVHWIMPSIGSDPLGHMHSTFTAVARLVGRETAAAGWVARTDEALEAGRAALAGRGLPPVYVARLMEDGRHMAVFGRNGMIGAVVARLELANAWTGRTNAWGNAAVGIEELAGNPEAGLIHFHRGAESDRALRLLADSPLWNALPAVRAGRVLAVPVVYPAGGPFSAVRLANALAARLSGGLGHG